MYDIICYIIVMEKNKHLGFYKHGNLPHLDVGAALQFVTFVLADAAPPFRNPQWNLTRGRSGLELFARLDWQLDRGQGSCLLNNLDNAQLVMESIQLCAGRTHRPLAWAIMPNHVHLLTRQLEGSRLGDVVNQIKSRAARLINSREHREGKLWQRGYFDRAMRDMQQLRTTVAYIHDNPVQAGLVARARQWRFSSAREYSEESLMESLSETNAVRRD